MVKIVEQNKESFPHKHGECISKAKSRFTQRLQEIGKSVGKNDEPILDLLLSDHRIFSAYDIVEKMYQAGKRIQAIQVYRALEKLIGMGVVHKISTKNGYIACYTDGKCAVGQFLICNKCESVQEIDSGLLNHEIHNTARANNFSIATKSVEMIGICGNCQQI